MINYKEQIRFNYIDNFAVSKNPIVNIIKRLLGDPVTKWDFLREELEKEAREDYILGKVLGKE